MIQMSFAYPLGLLALLGVPILILLYIIKSRYAEQTVASVYLWELSERFLKKKKRIRFNGLFLLIVEIIAVIAVAMTVARPTFTLKDAANDYCFILDASGSMNAERDGESRFDVGKARIKEIIDASKDGSTYSLVVAGNTTWEAFRGVSDRDVAISVLDTVEGSWLAGDHADAFAVAQTYYTADHSPLTYLITDKNGEIGNVTLINVSDTEENYALVSYTYQKKYSELTVSGQVISCDRDADIEIALYIDGSEHSRTTVRATKSTPADFTFTSTSTAFDALKIVILNPDALPSDNEGILYGSAETKNNRTLIISDDPTYLKGVLTASGKTAVDVVGTEAYSSAQTTYTGYGLYVFDSFSDSERLPDELPKDGTIWFFDLQKSIPRTGFSFREVVVAEGKIGDADAGTERENCFEPTYTTSTSSFAMTLTAGLLKDTVSVKKYSRYVPNRVFTNILTCDGDGLIFVGNNENDNKQVVFAFDLHDTDLVLKPDFFLLMDNLLSYSFPEVIEERLYTVGDEVTVNLPSGCTELSVTAPDGRVTHPEMSSAYSYFTLGQVGTYTVTATVNGNETEYLLYSQLPKEESYELSLPSSSLEKQSDSTASDGYYDKLVIYFIILALAFVLDWGVYCYEQYQLR